MYKRILDGKKAVLFDLDGTIFDSQPLWTQAYEKVLATLDMDWILDTDIPAGITNAGIWKLLIEANSEYFQKPPIIKDLVEHTHTEYLKLIASEDVDVRDGFWELLADLKGNKQLKVGMVTNTDRAITSQVMNRLGINTAFDLVITGDEVSKPKPDPEIYVEAAKKLGVTPQEILVFEDSVAGADAAVQAGMSLIVIWSGKPVKLYYPQDTIMFIPDFTSLVGTLDTTPEEDIQNNLREQKTPTDVA